MCMHAVYAIHATVHACLACTVAGCAALKILWIYSTCRLPGSSPLPPSLAPGTLPGGENTGAGKYLYVQYCNIQYPTSPIHRI